MKYIIALLISLALIIGVFGVNQFQSSNKIQNKYDLVKNGMSINTVKNYLGEEEAIFNDSGYDEYVWINYKNETQIRVRFKDGKATYKHINTNFKKDSFE